MKPSSQRVAARFLRSADPFDALDTSMQDAFRDFTYRLMMWMGMSDPIHLKALLKAWKFAPLRKWLAQNVNRGTSTLWYGGRLPPGKVPAIGDAHDRRYPVVQWSKDRRIAEWFAGIRDGMAPSNDADWAGGYLVQANAGPNQVIVDIDAFSSFVARHRDGFQSVVLHGDARAMFIGGEQREGEVLTLPIAGEIVAVKTWR